MQGKIWQRIVLLKCNVKSKTNTDLTFEQFLIQLEMNLEDYLLAIRSSIQRPKVFFKRSVSDVRINNYNTVLITCWEANMDILDPFACVSYIVSYISKGQRGLSNLLQDACTEVREMDSDIRQPNCRIGNQFLSSVEIGAQEAVYLVLQMPLRRCTRDVVYVDTSKPDDRTGLLNSMSELKDLPTNSRNVESDNVLKRYKRRSKQLERLCYADVAACYGLVRKQKHLTSSSQNNGVRELPETNYDHDHSNDLQDDNDNDNVDCTETNHEYDLDDGLQDDNDTNNDDDCTSGNVIKFPCGTQMRNRSSQKVIYNHSTALNDDREEHFRQKIMLFTQWRNEMCDLLHGFQTFEQSYHANLNEITINQSQYEKLDSDENETPFFAKCQQ